MTYERFYHESRDGILDNLEYDILRRILYKHKVFVHFGDFFPYAFSNYFASRKRRYIQYN